MPESKKHLLNVLIQLAKADGHLDKREEKVIRRVASSNDFSEADVQNMLENPTPVSTLSNLGFDDKFDLLYNLIILMKADDEVLDQEIVFIQKVLLNLGFRIAALMELYPYAHVNLKRPHDIKTLKKRVKALMLSDSERNNSPE